MALSADAVKRVAVAVAGKPAANEVVDALNSGISAAQQDLFCLPLLIIGTSTSATVDFGSLVVGDRVIMIPTVAGNAAFFTVVTAGTLPASGVVGNLFLVLRAYAPPTASAVTF